MTIHREKLSTHHMPTGKGVGDLVFLSGDWHIRHKRLNDGNNTATAGAPFTVCLVE